MRQAGWYKFCLFLGALMKQLTACLIAGVGLIGTPAFAADMAAKLQRLHPRPPSITGPVGTSA
jgi:hypothetical protein